MLMAIADTLETTQRQLASAEKKPCEWNRLDGDECYETDCGQMWVFTAGNVEENGMIYCHHCGGKVIDVLGEEF